MAASDAPGAPRSSVRFILDGAVRTLSACDPNRTVLDYLRNELGRTGTKEGCAEGDCGACTVVIAEPREGRIRYRAVNACIQFLPALDGKELITVESLGSARGALHPVQRAMVACHASQCGFCTPGFVMSLFALYRSEPRPSRARIDDVLAGNLCRCTGYRPIIDAAREMYRLGGAVAGDERNRMNAPFDASGEPPVAGEREAYRRLDSIRPREALALVSRSRDGAERRYFAPVTLAELAELAARYPDACLLAGGTDVGLWVTKGLRDLDCLIYLGNVPELRRLDVRDGHIEVGAAVTLSDAHPVIAAQHPDLGELLRRFASPPIRNVATLAGNVANASPIGDCTPGLMALGARVVLRRGQARRELPLDAFYAGYRRTVMQPGELIERLRIPAGAPGTVLRIYKVAKRYDQDIAALCGAFFLELEGDTVRRIRIAFGGMAATPKRALHCERALTGLRWSAEAVRAAGAALERDFTPISDLRASAAYRRLVARNLLRKFHLETSGGAQPARVWGHAEAQP